MSRAASTLHAALSKITHEQTELFRCDKSYIRTGSKAGHEARVLHGQAAKGRRRHPALSQEVLNIGKKLIACVHGRQISMINPTMQ